MAKQEKSVHKKSRGRPAGRSYGETVPVRFKPETVAAIDKWAADQGVSRSHALRMLIELGLKK